MSEYQLIQKKRTTKSLQELSESSERLEFGEPLYVNDTTNNVAYEISGEDPSFTIPNNKMMKYHGKNIVDKGVFYETPNQFSTYGGTGVQLTDDTGANITPDIPATNVFYSKDGSYQTVQNTLDNIYSTGIPNADHANTAGVANKVNLLAAPEPEDYEDIKLVPVQMESTGGYLPQYPTSSLTFTPNTVSNTVTFSGTGPVAEAGGLPGAWVFLTGTIVTSVSPATEYASGWLDIDNTQIKRNHTYRLSGCPAGGSEQSYYLCMQLKTTASATSYLTYIDTGNSVDITVPDDYSFFRVFIFVVAQREEHVIDLTDVMFNPVITPITPFNNYFLLGALGNSGEQQLYAVPAQYTQSGMVTEAMWNDYAEGRNCPYLVEPGMCVVEDGGGKVRPSEKYLETPAGIVSNTHGMFIGNSVPNAKPIAVAGRVLAFVEDKKCLKIGDALKTAPNGKVAKMTKREMRKHPDKIVGYVSEFPTYENYNNVPVNGRIWVRVK